MYITMHPQNRSVNTAARTLTSTEVSKKIFAFMSHYFIGLTFLVLREKKIPL